MLIKFSEKWTNLLLTGFIIIGFLNPIVSATEDVTESKVAEPLPLEQLRLFAGVYNRIKNSYIEDVDDEVLLKGAIAGMLDSLDPHSSFLTKDAFEKIQDSSTGQYGGLGIEVVPQNDSIRIITPIDGSPAKRAGILPGDQILKINKIPLRNIKAVDAMDLMRGDIGEKIHLTIRREGESELLEVDLVREIIQLSSIHSKWLGDGMATIRITQFQSRTGYDLVDAIETLREENNGKIDGLVLDLRNNPGGMLVAANAVSDAFLNQGIIVSTRGKIAQSNAEYNATEGDILYGAPIVILINSGSASAAEIVAGALQDHGRAIIMGTRSFGKGSVQTLVPIDTNTALKLTTARYYTPSGSSIQGSGIVPDIVVEQVEILNDDVADSTFYESDLKGALTNEIKNNQQKEYKNSNEIDTLLANDYQLSEALNLLLGIRILSTKSTRQWKSKQ